MFEATLDKKIMYTPQIDLSHIIDNLVAILVFAFLVWISKFHILISYNSFWHYAFGIKFVYFFHK